MIWGRPDPDRTTIGITSIPLVKVHRAFRHEMAKLWIIFMKDIRKRSKAALVVEILEQYPNLNDQEVANRAGCNRTSLYRMTGFKTIRDNQAREREAARQTMPQGSKTTDRKGYQDRTILDVWDKRQLSPLDYLIAQEEEMGFDR